MFFDGVSTTPGVVSTEGGAVEAADGAWVVGTSGDDAPEFFELEPPQLATNTSRNKHATTRASVMRPRTACDGSRWRLLAQVVRTRDERSKSKPVIARPDVLPATDNVSTRLVDRCADLSRVSRRLDAGQ